MRTLQSIEMVVEFVGAVVAVEDPVEDDGDEGSGEVDGVDEPPCSLVEVVAATPSVVVVGDDEVGAELGGDSDVDEGAAATAAGVFPT